MKVGYWYRAADQFSKEKNICFYVVAWIDATTPLLSGSSPRLGVSLFTCLGYFWIHYRPWMNIWWDIWYDVMLIDRACDPDSEVSTGRRLVYICQPLEGVPHMTHAFPGTLYFIRGCYFSLSTSNQLTDKQIELDIKTTTLPLGLILLLALTNLAVETLPGPGHITRTLHNYCWINMHTWTAPP